MTARAARPLFEHLLVFDDVSPRRAAMNMALDETLLHDLADVPMLRIYRWERPAVSFGFFEPWREVNARFPGRELVRRWTGGGLVEHGEDFTYSLLVPRSDALANGRAGESYQRIHLALRECLHRSGVREVDLGEELVAAPPPVLRECFAQPVRFDLMQAGRKLGGAAQRRTRRGLLHQGSLRPVEGAAFDHRQMTLILPGVLSRFTSCFQANETVLSQAGRLAAEKYANPSWLRRR